MMQFFKGNIIPSFYLFILLEISMKNFLISNAYVINHPKSIGRFSKYKSSKIDSIQNLTYVGKVTNSNEMFCSTNVPNFSDLLISIGPANFGLGLFLSIKEESIEEQVYVPKGTLICEYIGGKFDNELKTDKAVSFGYSGENEIYSWVYYKGKLQKLWEAVLDSNSNQDISNVRNKLEGHIMSVENNEIQIEINTSYNNTCLLYTSDAADE